jgi:hypothetical protein
MENWRKFLKEETSLERMRRRQEENERKRQEKERQKAEEDKESGRKKRIGRGEWTKEDKEWVLFTFEDEIQDFEETYGRKPRKSEVTQYLQEKGSEYRSVGGAFGIPILFHNQPGRPLFKQIGEKPGVLDPEPLRLYDVYKNDIKNSILPLEGKPGFDQWAEKAEKEAGGKPIDFAKAMVRWMKNGGVISDHPRGLQAGLADAQIGTILRLTHLTPDDIFENMEMLVKSGQSPEQAAQAISDTDEHATMNNPNFDPDQEESKDNPQKIDLVIADPKIILRMYKYYKAAGF